LSAGDDFAFPSVLRSLMGAEAERYEGLRLFRATGNVGCLGVVPLPFDLDEDGAGRDSDNVAAIPLSEYLFDDCCAPLYSL
jgi:hypothetical protein